MSKNSHDQGGTRGDVFSEGIVKEYTRAFDDGAVNVKFQIIRLEKQVFVYVGLLDATLDSMSIALPTAQVRALYVLLLPRIVGVY